MTLPLRSHASVRSYYFREACAELDHRNPAILDSALASDFRPYWREADAKAREWRRRATNRYDHATQTWSNPK